MAQNVNTNDVYQLGFGPWTLNIGAYNPTAAGGTPATSVGAVSGPATLTPNRTVVPVMQGAPAKEIDAFVSEESLEVAFTGIQWNLPLIQQALGGGPTPTVSGDATTFDMGNDVLMTQLSLQATHVMPNGGTVVLNVWKARGNGTVPITIPPDNVHQASYTFMAVEGLSDWTNAALAAKSKLFQIVYTKPPAAP